MTWREGVEYWRSWARQNDGDTIEDAARLTAFYEALLRHNPDLDNDIPPALVSELGMSP